jgi:hypothetical protein
MSDDVSATRGNSELAWNGRFEYNMIDWTLTVYSNGTSTTVVDSLSGGQRTGTAYMYGASMNAFAYLK